MSAHERMEVVIVGGVDLISRNQALCMTAPVLEKGHVDLCARIAFVTTSVSVCPCVVRRCSLGVFWLIFCALFSLLV